MSVLDDLKKKNGFGNAFQTLPQKNELSCGRRNSNQLSISKAKMQGALSELQAERISRTTGNDIQKRMQNYSATIVQDVDKKLKASSLELVFVLDKSGSCDPFVDSTCKSFDQLIKQEQGKGMQTTVSLTLFNDSPEVIYNRVPIKQITPLRYYGEGNTALFDTLYEQIIRIENAQKINAPAHTMVIIMTDGLDNYSREHSLEDCRKLITRKQKEGWEFLFLGAMDLEKDTVSYGNALGVSPSNIQHYLPEDTSLNFNAIETAINDVRMIGSISPDWSKIIKENNQKKNLGSASKQIGTNASLRLERKNY